jgi:16S rRNA (guanine527-N7)-methyltransferase
VGARKLRDRLIRRAKAAGLEPSEGLLGGLETYFLELARWNEKVNLTAFALEGGGTDAAIDRLLIEPLLAARHIPAGATSLLDAGSGGGSPALPMKLARPDLTLHMVEAKVRKSAFLRQVTRLLALPGVHVHTARFEELLTRADLHESMSAVSVRAVRIDSQALLSLQAFVRPGGVILSFATRSGKVPVVPPLSVAAVYDLLPASGTQLVVLEKASIWPFRST